MSPRIYTRQPLEERFWAKVDKAGPVPALCPALGACWIWTANIDTSGYGRITAGGRRGKLLIAHRYSYQMHKGFLWPGEELDHLCRVLRCVNPDHLEQVTSTENMHRSHNPFILIHLSNRCGRGHEKISANGYFRSSSPGSWRCKICEQLAARSKQR